MKRLLLISVTFVAACSAASEDVGSNDAFDTVHPVGTDFPASLLVTLPVGAENASPVVNLDGNTITVGSTVTGLPIGKHQLTVDGFHATVDLVGNQTFVYKLAAFKLKLPSVRVLGINNKDKDGYVTGSVSFADGDGNTGYIGNPGALDGSDPNRVFAVPQGHFHARWGAGDGTRFDVVAGQIGLLDLDSPLGRRIVRLQAPIREFADVPTQGSTPAAAWSFSGRSGDDTGWSPAVAHVDDGSSLLAGVEGDGSLDFATPYSDEVRLSLGPLGGAPSFQHIGRIDVDDVALTGAGGTTKVSGWYQVTGNLGVNIGFSTQSGIDVWPGTFDVSTRYQTASSGEQVDKQTIVVR